MAVSFPADIFKQSQSTLEGWKKITPATPIGALTPEVVAAELAKVQPLLAEVNALEAQLTSIRNQRDAVYDNLWDHVKRIRNGVKAIFGDDSSEYEMVGGTRSSERKPRTLKAVPNGQ